MTNLYLISIRPDVFFIHPIPRQIHNPLRTRIRERLGYGE